MPEFTVTQAQIRINVVWFLSLTVSLTTVLVGILCLQWLREFQRDATLSHKDAVALRQMRYEGLTEWYVPGILSILPLLLQLSLVLFFIGLLDLLWSINTFVAACVSAVIGMVMLFLIVTTALPALQRASTRDKHLRVPQCPYKSPQSWLFYRAGRRFFYILLHCFFRLFYRSRIFFLWYESLLQSIRDNNWLAYDLRWRTLRDAKDLSWQGQPMMIRDSDDVVHGLHWINKTFAHSVEAIFPVYHSLAELDIAAAAATISEIYLEGSRLDHPRIGLHYLTFNALMDDQSSRNEMQNRDIIAAYYLNLYQDRHPLLKQGFVETVIRILKTQDVSTSFYRWLSQILGDMWLEGFPVLSVTTRAAAQLNTNEITVQTLLCINKFLITRDILLVRDVITAWILLHRLLTLPPPLPNLGHSTPPIDSEPPNLGLGLNLDHIEIAGGLFEGLEGWLSQGEEKDRRERVKVCMEGMIRLFSSSIDIAALSAVCPEQMAKAAGLVRALDEHLSRLGDAATVLGAATVLKRRRSWDTAYGVGEWESLVSRFQGIEGGGGHSDEMTTP